MHRTTRSSRPALPEDDGWAILAQPAGVRDLGRVEYWELSRERSRRRREARNLPRVARGPASRMSLALAAASIGAPVAIGAAGAQRAVASTSSTTVSLSLGRGSTGALVRALQQKLGISADGVFGPQTVRAVKQFQRTHGIRSTGFVGTLTTRALGLTSGSASTAAVRSASSGGGSSVHGLRQGATGAAVRALQQRLGITADGVFGARTLAAVIAFQRGKGIPATGYVGSLTTKALQSSSTPASTAAAGAKRISMDPDVARAMQQKLGVAADGVVGPRTIAAVRSFQAAHGLTVDGVPGPATLSAMGISASGSASTRTAAPAGAGAQAAMSAAMSKSGATYRYGGTGPSSFDCSGLVQWAFAQAGISLPRTSFSQYGVGSPVSSSQIQAGDLVFFSTAGPGASDVGIATSPTSAISSTTHGVMVHPILTGYWGSHFVGARRVG